MQPPDGMIPVSSPRSLLVSMEMSRIKTPVLSFQPRTDRAARPGLRDAFLGDRGGVLRVGGDTVRVCALLLGRCGGTKRGEQSISHFSHISHTNEPASTI